MRIVKDPFLDDIEMIVPLHDKRILEIGCGRGTRSVKIAERCKRLVAIEPTGTLIARAARINTQPNLSYVRASAVSLHSMTISHLKDLRLIWYYLHFRSTMYHQAS